ncbi:hypothetical protein PFISCL1PPCAC_16021 [Pristionchus fissidentatus]|uniref:Mitochondrial import receptor subunit TOM20 homolog n=1 Tax=Pristionchus fissidentatus TaxID=1538716 RepID=A0AAV5VYM3_9BILA|nr:hypothetical protein PFISCL1PPCAC_16021 [Pristionchus fissidentatus]
MKVNHVVCFVKHEPMAQPMQAGGSSVGLFEWTKNNLGVVASIAGAAVVGFAIYYDNKRRTAPDYKDKIRQKRREKAAKRGNSGGSSMGNIDVPNPMNPTDMQSFFLQEVQLGEELMAAGNLDEGAEHIANAVIICGQGNQLLSIFQQTLPPEHFALVLEKLPSAKQRLADRFSAAADILEMEENQTTERVVFTVCTDDDDDVTPSRSSPDPHHLLLPEPHPHLPAYDPPFDDVIDNLHNRSPGLTHSLSDSAIPKVKLDRAASCGSRCARPYSVAKVVRTVFSSHFLPRL